MKAFLQPGIRFALFMLAIMEMVGCSTAMTSLRHSGDFSNIRSEIVLNNGSSFLAYSTYKENADKKHLIVRIPGEIKEHKIPLSEINKLKVEESDYVIKLLQSPLGSKTFQVKSTSKVIVRRLGSEEDAIQVFEHKYQVINPKSTISNWETGYFVSFPGDAEGHALTQMGTQLYKQKWQEFSFKMHQKNIVFKPRAPVSPKVLIEQMKQIPEKVILYHESGATGN